MSVLVIGQHYWGHGSDLAAAKRQFRLEGGELSRGYNVVEFGEGLTFEGVDGLGQVYWKGDGRPTITEHPSRGRR